MANNIERLNYYEREYLRSFDFIAEQNYHVEMRRRLNIALHLWGIVEGLDIQKAVIVTGAPAQVFITPGMAIDAFGREIFLFANYTLSADDLENSRIRTNGSHSLFIGYSKEPTTPPSPGFGLCDVKDQYTRLRESFKIVISDEADPTNPPSSFSELSDDPIAKPWLVRLGTVTVDTDPLTGKPTIVDATAEKRVYIGLRAQRVVTPADATKVYKILEANTSLLPPTSVSVQANLFAEQNAIIGTDFQVKQADILPQPQPVAPAVFPNPTGNLKVASDLFLRGNLYANVDTKWLTLGEHIKSLMPEILVGLHPMQIPSPHPTDPGNGTEKFSVSTTRLKRIGNVQVTASIAAVVWNDAQTRFDIFTQTSGAVPTTFQVISASGARNAGTPNSCDIEVAWKVAPTAEFSTGPAPSDKEFRSAIVGLTFAYIVICNP